jgi:Ca2+-binding RTX toxin-like protein
MCAEQSSSVEGRELSIVSSVADDTGIVSATIMFEWLRDGELILQASGPTYALRQDDVGSRISVVQKFTNGIGINHEVTSLPSLAVQNVNDPPVGSILVMGTLREGETLRAEAVNVTDEDGFDASLAQFQWLRDGVKVPGETNASYTLSSNDFNTTIIAEYRYTDSFGSAETVASEPTDMISGAWGSNESDVITGTDASEAISAYDGFDWILPGRGNDTVDGGAGRDMVSFSDQPLVAGRTNLDFMLDLNLQAGTANLFGGETNQLINVERATGTIYADVMRGTNGNDELRGLGDYDWFVATSGNDTLDGGNGQDMITFLEWGGSGAAVVEDIFSTTGAPPMGAAASGITLDLSNPANSTGLAAGLTLISVERVTGSSYQDVFYGDAEQNVFRGLGGYDWFVGSPGGRERYFGGDGDDTVTYYQSETGVSASLRNGVPLDGRETGYGSVGDAARDLFFEIENLVGTNFGDRLEGNSARNQLSGLEGDDFIFGYGGTDYIKGGGGDDVINGGAGSDFALYDGDLADYTLTRTSSTEVSVTGTDGNDSLINVEYFQFDDTTANIWELAIV